MNEPISAVQWVSRELLQANDYNPNRVMSKELGLLKLSIMSDGWTQPIVTIYDKELQKYVIVDGFHRYFVSSDPELYKRTGGKVPIVVLEKTIAERMAATVRHNRARGVHKVSGMSGIVYGMLKNGKKDAEICSELGMSPDELFRLKHITGYAKLYEDHEYNKEWIITPPPHKKKKKLKKK